MSYNAFGGRNTNNIGYFILCFIQFEFVFFQYFFKCFLHVENVLITFMVTYLHFNESSVILSYQK